MLILGVGWGLYVFGGSQSAYLCATAASVVLAVRLASVRSQALVLLLVAEVGLLGTDANGQLAGGTALIGSFRLFDLTVAASLFTVGAGWLRNRFTGPASASGDQRANPRAIRLTRVLIAVIVSLFGYALLLWFVHGHRFDQITRADVRVVCLGIAMWVISQACIATNPLTSIDLPVGVASLSPFIAAKALAIYLSGLWVIGSNDRLQASSDYSYGHTRIILIGGDTLLILIPAIALLALARQRGIVARSWMWLCATSALVGLLLSGTRSGLIVAVLMLIFVIVLRRRSWRTIDVRTIAVASCALTFFVTGAIATGTASRFLTRDPPHVGVNFRADELRAILRIPTDEIIVGQGPGGRFVGKDVNGLPVVTGWAHSFPSWVVLKIGVIGLVLSSLLTIAWLWRGLRYIWTATPLPANHTLGLILFLGVLLMSLSLGRAALAEGAILLGLGAALLRPSSRGVRA